MKYIKPILVIIIFFITIAATPGPPQPQAIPPPVGAPVTINKDIMLLFASGILLGAFFVIKKIN
jgi:hypothetical protein